MTMSIAKMAEPLDRSRYHLRGGLEWAQPKSRVIRWGAQPGKCDGLIDLCSGDVGCCYLYSSNFLNYLSILNHISESDQAVLTAT